MRIAVLGVRVPGHLNPMTTLARRLKARGHDVVFISILDTEPHVRAAQLPFIPYCEKEFPLGSVRQRTDQQSKLQGQAALEFVDCARYLEDQAKSLQDQVPQASPCWNLIEVSQERKDAHEEL
jgi:UDP:flavonoid glycosyltransferase YjiC (YdhE family)